MAGEDIYRLRHWHKALLDEPGADVARVAIEGRMGQNCRVWRGCTAR